MRSFRHADWSIIFLTLAAGALGACSSSSGAPTVTDASTIDAPKDTPASDTPSSTDTQVTDGGFDYGMLDGPLSQMTMTLTSSALPNNGVFMDANTCAGVNTSPPLVWSAGPAGTMSYAVSLTNQTFEGAAHWVIWNIPAAVLSLPPSLPGTATLTNPAGAMQLHRTAFFMAGFDYRGPCPSGATHTYVFEVTAIPTATLTLGTNPTTEEIRSVIDSVGLAHGDLTGTSNATAPPADAGGQ